MQDVELKRITAEEQVKIEMHKKQMRIEVGTCKTFNDLWKIQRERGYSPAWVYKMAKIKGIKR